MRKDLKDTLQKVFMQQSEIENCTFEPATGALDSKSKKQQAEVEPGAFFEKLGDDFMTSNPKIYKTGILKKSQLHLRQGNMEKALLTMYEGFNVNLLNKHVFERDYIAWKNHKDLQAGAFKDTIQKLKDEMSKRWKETAKKEHLVKFFEEAKEKCDEMVKDNKNKKAVYAENFEKP